LQAAPPSGSGLVEKQEPDLLRTTAATHIGRTADASSFENFWKRFPRWSWQPVKLYRPLSGPFPDPLAAGRHTRSMPHCLQGKDRLTAGGSRRQL